MNVQAAFYWFGNGIFTVGRVLRDYTHAETAAESEKQPAPVKNGVHAALLPDYSARVI